MKDAHSQVERFWLFRMFFRLEVLEMLTALPRAAARTPRNILTNFAAQLFFAFELK